MSAHMKKHHTEEKNVQVIIIRSDVLKRFTVSQAEAGRLSDFLKTLRRTSPQEELVPAEEVFKDLHEKYGRVGSMVRGYRARDGFTQKELAKKLQIHQVHISQIENGKRTVGKALAKKLAKVFHSDYRLFL